jgi:hypothetical protein
MHRKDWHNHKHKALGEKSLKNARGVFTHQSTLQAASLLATFLSLF